MGRGPSRGRGAQLALALRLLVLLRVGRWCVDDLAAELGVERRTVYRIIAALREAGVTVEAQPADPRPGVVVEYGIPEAPLRRLLRCTSPLGTR